MYKKFTPYFLHIVLALASIVAAYFLLKPHYKTTGLSIGLINMQRVQTEALPYVQLQKKAADASTAIQEKAQNYENTLRTEYDEFQSLQKKKKLKADDFSKRSADFNQKVADVEQSLKQEREETEQSCQRVLNGIEAKLAKIVTDFRKMKKVDLLLNTTNNYHEIGLADDHLDHTDEIIKLLNEKIPSIEELGK